MSVFWGQGNPHLDAGFDPVHARAEFNTAVRDFKKSHGVKLRHMFSNGNAQTGELWEKFWSTPAITNYLSRSARHITFKDNHPDFIVDRENKSTNDYYEWRLYDLSRQFAKVFLPYRKYSLEETFYTQGTSTEKINPLIPFNKENERISIRPSKDIYQIRKDLMDLQLDPSNKVRFVLSPNDKDTHSTTLISILENGSDRILASIMINSWDSDHYFEYVRERYVKQGTDSNQMSPESVEMMIGRVKNIAHLEDGYIDRVTGSAYIIDGSYFRYPHPVVTKIEQEFAEGKIKKIFFNNKRGDYFVKDCRPVVFLDASHHLQTDKKDKNCALYSFNILHAASQMLEDPAFADQVYKLALQANDGTDKQKAEAQQSLVKVFREDIKKFIPCYYNGNGSPKSTDELREFHLRQRWEIGSLAAKNQEYRHNVSMTTDK